MAHRLDESYSREAGNAEAVAQVLEAAAACLSDMQTAFSAAVADQRRRSEDVSAALDAYLQQKATDLATVQVSLFSDRHPTYAGSAIRMP